MVDNKKIDEGYGDSWQNPNSGTASPFFNPIGLLGSWYSRFFGSKKQPAVQSQTSHLPSPIHPLGGDTIVSRDVVKNTELIVPGIVRNLRMPELELNRKNRYSQYESMDEYPEIGAAFDIYADDCTQRDLNGKRWKVVSESPILIKEVNRFFKQIKLDQLYWDIIRGTVKYGDCFIESVVDLNNVNLGVQRIKVLNPNFIIRVENEYGYLTDFLQEIPENKDNGWRSFGNQSYSMEQSKFLSLDKNQITHFRLTTSDPKFYPYGKGIGAFAIRVFRSLKLMEDAMLVYRLSRAPERRVFYINTGNLPTNKAEVFVQQLQRKFKKEKFFDSTTGNIDEKYNPLSVDEDFFVPHRGDKETKIEVLPGAQNLGEVDDVKYFRDKLLACLKIPKDYVVEHDKSPERKANLSQLDVKFARVIMRVQHDIEVGLETIVRRHLTIKKFPTHLINCLSIELPDPSDMFTKRKLDINEAKARVVGSIKSLKLFSNKHIYKDFYDMTDSEIEEMKTQIIEEMEDPVLGATGGGMMDPGLPAGGEEENGMPGEEKNAEVKNGGESTENDSNPKEAIKYLEKMAILHEDSIKVETLNRILAKYAK